MEEHSSVDISIRNVPVRLNESNVVESELNGESVKSLFVPTSSESDTQVTHFNEDFETKSSSVSSNLSDELHDKLHISQNTDNCELINGCKLLQDDMKCVHISVNGIKKCNNYELLNAHFDQINNRTCSETKIESSDIRRTNFTENECQPSSVKNFSPVESSRIESTVCNDIVMPDNDITKSFRTLKVSDDASDQQEVNISYLGYDSESQMPDIMRLIQKDLSEPYSIYTYRYFIHNWPKLCFLVCMTLQVP